MLEQGKAIVHVSPQLCNLRQPLGSEDLSSDKRTVVDDQHQALDHKHTYIHVLAYGIVPAGWLLSPFFTKKMGESSNGSNMYMYLV